MTYTAFFSLESSIICLLNLLCSYNWFTSPMSPNSCLIKLEIMKYILLISPFGDDFPAAFRPGPLWAACPPGLLLRSSSREPQPQSWGPPECLWRMSPLFLPPWMSSRFSGMSLHQVPDKGCVNLARFIVVLLSDEKFHYILSQSF